MSDVTPEVENEDELDAEHGEVPVDLLELYEAIEWREATSEPDRDEE